MSVKENLLLLSIILTSFLTISGCSSDHVRTDIDTVKSGTIHISVDETFKPVIDSEIEVFESLFPQAKVIAVYVVTVTRLPKCTRFSRRIQKYSFTSVFMLV